MPLVRKTTECWLSYFINRKKIERKKYKLTHLSSSLTVLLMWNVFAVPLFPRDRLLGSKSIFAGLTKLFVFCSKDFSWKFEVKSRLMMFLTFKEWIATEYCPKQKQCFKFTYLIVLTCFVMFHWRTSLTSKTGQRNRTFW